MNAAASSAALAAFGKALPQNPKDISSALWMAALNQGLVAYEAARPIDLPEKLPSHIEQQFAHVYEQSMENHEGSLTATRKAYAELRRLMQMDAVVRERIAKL